MCLKKVAIPFLTVCLLLGGCTQEGNQMELPESIVDPGFSEGEERSEIQGAEKQSTEDTERDTATKAEADSKSSTSTQTETEAEPKQSSDADASFKPPVQDGTGTQFRPEMGEGVPKEGMVPPEGFKRGENGGFPGKNGANAQNRPEGKFPNVGEKKPQQPGASTEAQDETGTSVD